MAIPTVTFWHKDGRSVTINRDDQETQAEWKKAGFTPEGVTVVEEDPEPEEELEVEVELEEEPKSEEVPEEDQEDKEAQDLAAGEIETKPRPSRTAKKKK